MNNITMSESDEDSKKINSPKRTTTESENKNKVKSRCRKRKRYDFTLFSMKDKKNINMRRFV